MRPSTKRNCSGYSPWSDSVPPRLHNAVHRSEVTYSGVLFADLALTADLQATEYGWQEGRHSSGEASQHSWHRILLCQAQEPTDTATKAAVRQVRPEGQATRPFHRDEVTIAPFNALLCPAGQHPCQDLHSSLVLCCQACTACCWHVFSVTVARL